MVIGFIGAGVMARALAKGILDCGGVPAKNMVFSTPTEQGGKAFLDAFPEASWTSSNAEVVRQSDLTVIAVKPQVFPEASSKLREASAGKLFLSLMAGVTLEKIGAALDPTARVVRAMPNLPMQVGKGASVFVGGPNTTDKDLTNIHRVLSTAGRAWPVEEAQIDAITALSGSGPAYLFHFIDAMIRGGTSLGLPEKLAHELAIQTVLGSAILASQSTLSPIELAAQVKSPKGTTLAGCAVLEEKDGLNQLIARCMAATKNRAEELSRGNV